jgi:hypothetical protein
MRNSFSTLPHSVDAARFRDAATIQRGSGLSGAASFGVAISENAERPARLRDGAPVASEVFLPGVGGAALDRHRTLRFVCRIGRDRRIKCGDVSVGPSVSVRVGMVSTFGCAGWQCLHRVIRGDFGARPVNGLRRTLAARCGSYADDKISSYRRRRIGADGRRYEREPARPNAARRGLHWLRVIGLSTRAATFCLAKIWRESGRRIVPRLFPIRTASTSGRMDGPPAKPRTPPPRGVGPLCYCWTVKALKPRQRPRGGLS